MDCKKKKKKNISFRAITDNDFKGFIETLGNFKVPSETTIREFIKNFAKYTLQLIIKMFRF